MIVYIFGKLVPCFNLITTYIIEKKLERLNFTKSSLVFFQKLKTNCTNKLIAGKLSSLVNYIKFLQTKLQKYFRKPPIEF